MRIRSSQLIVLLNYEIIDNKIHVVLLNHKNMIFDYYFFVFMIKYFFNSLLFSYTQNGLLNMLDRNRRIKQHPERFQLCNEQFNVVITCEERVYDQVLECMLILTITAILRKLIKSCH